eukprot:scpid20792/ scgid3519/ Serine/threonine-protein kinase SMG1
MVYISDAIWQGRVRLSCGRLLHHFCREHFICLGNAYRAMSEQSVYLGTFRLSCERVLRLMRSGRETLLTLLEAFVYDPLVDWESSTSSDGHAAASALALARGGAYRPPHTTAGASTTSGKPAYRMTKAQRALESEISVNSALLLSRMAEVQTQWTQHCTSLSLVFRQASSLLSTLANTSQQITACKNKCSSLYQQQELYQAALVQPNHPLVACHIRYAEKQRVLEEKSQIICLAVEKINECTAWEQQYQTAYDYIQSADIQRKEVMRDFSHLFCLGRSPYEAVVEFLVGAGQESLVSQSKSAEQDLQHALQTQRVHTTNLLSALMDYSAIVSHFPRQYVERGRWSDWKSVLQSDLVESSCPTLSCDLVISLYSETHSTQLTDTVVTTSIVHRHCALHTQLTGHRNRLMEAQARCDALTMSTADLDEVVQSSTLHVNQTLTTGNGDSAQLSSAAIAISCASMADLAKAALIAEQNVKDLSVKQEDVPYCSTDADRLLNEFVVINSRFSSIVQLLEVNVSETLPVISSISRAAQKVQHVYTQLQELVIRFDTEIAPQLFSAVCRRAPPGSDRISALCAVVTGSLRTANGAEWSSATLADMLQQCLTLSTIQIMDTEKVAMVHSAVNGYRSKIASILSDTTGQTTQGSQVQEDPVSALFDLFHNVEVAIADVLQLETELTCDVASDVSSAAANLIEGSGGVSTSALLADVFYVQFCTLLAGIVSKCQHTASHLHAGMTKDLTSPVVSLAPLSKEDLDLSSPMRSFVLDSIRHRLVGRSSRILAVLCVNAMSVIKPELASSSESEEPVELQACAGELLSTAAEQCATENAGWFETLNSAMKANDASINDLNMAKCLDQHVACLKSQHKLASNQLLQFEWLNHDSLVALRNSSATVNSMQPTTRTSILDSIKKHLTVLKQHQSSSLSSAVEQVSSLDATITSRLRWASGTNPLLSATMASFEEDTKLRHARGKEESSRVSLVTDCCRNLLHMEALRSNSQDTLAADQAFLSLLKRYSVNASALEAVMERHRLDERASAVEEIVQKTGWPCNEAGRSFSRDYLSSQLSVIPQRITDEMLQVQQLTSEGQHTIEAIATVCSRLESLLPTNKKLLSGCKVFLQPLSRLSAQSVHNGFLARAAAFLGSHKALTNNMRSVLTASSQVRIVSDESILYSTKINTSISSSTGVDHTSIGATASSNHNSRTPAEFCPFNLSSADLYHLVGVMENLGLLVAWQADELCDFLSTDSTSTSPSSAKPCPDLRLNIELSSVQAMSVLTASPHQERKFHQQQQQAQRNHHTSNNTPTAVPATGATATAGSYEYVEADQAAATSTRNTTATLRDPRTGKALQNRNMYSIGVLQLVRSKLEGRDQELAARRMSVTEHVANLIQSATSTDNLCMMYEGWTSWV